jgi:hypothetical protein
LNRSRFRYFTRIGGDGNPAWENEFETDSIFLEQQWRQDDIESFGVDAIPNVPKEELYKFAIRPLHHSDGTRKLGVEIHWQTNQGHTINESSLITNQPASSMDLSRYSRREGMTSVALLSAGPVTSEATNLL